MFVEVPVLRLVGAEQYECRPAGGQSCSDTVLSNWAKWVHPNVSHMVPNPDIRKVWGKAVSGAVPPSNNLFSWSTVKPFKSHGSSTSPALNFTILLLICFSRAPWTLWKCCPIYFVRLSWSTKTEIISDLVYSFCTFTDSIGKIFACVTHNLIFKRSLRCPDDLPFVSGEAAVCCIWSLSLFKCFASRRYPLLLFCDACSLDVFNYAPGVDTWATSLAAELMYLIIKYVYV